MAEKLLPIIICTVPESDVNAEELNDLTPLAKSSSLEEYSPESSPSRDHSVQTDTSATPCSISSDHVKRGIKRIRVFKAVNQMPTQIGMKPEQVLASAYSHQFRNLVFNSFAEFETAFDVWKKDGLHTFRVASSEMLKQLDGTVDTKFRYRYVVYHCVHYGEPRFRGIGKRAKTTSYLPCGCGAMLRLNYNFASQVLHITSLIDQHTGHTPSPEQFQKMRNRNTPRTHPNKKSSPIIRNSHTNTALTAREAIDISVKHSVAMTHHRQAFLASLDLARHSYAQSQRQENQSGSEQTCTSPESDGAEQSRSESELRSLMNSFLLLQQASISDPGSPVMPTLASVLNTTLASPNKPDNNLLDNSNDEPFVDVVNNDDHDYCMTDLKPELEEYNQELFCVIAQVAASCCTAAPHKAKERIEQLKRLQAQWDLNEAEDSRT